MHKRERPHGQGAAQTETNRFQDSAQAGFVEACARQMMLRGDGACASREFQGGAA
jgi:hypothetical protein